MDACSPPQLIKCDCRNKLTKEAVPLTIYGFQFSLEDSIGFVLYNETCHSAETYLEVFDMDKLTKTMNDNHDQLQFHSVVATATGYFRMCFTHANQVKDIGTIAVRPSCAGNSGQQDEVIPKVLVEGSCVVFCPRTKIPIAGECKPDPNILHYELNQAQMISMHLKNADALRYEIFNRSLDDPEREYFVYRYKYELARILDADANRFEVASISPGIPNETFVVNAVFKAVPTADDAYGGTRSPAGLLALFKALAQDENSILWQTGDFLRDLDKPSLGEPMDVSLCASAKYRTLCPYTNIRRDISSVSLVFTLVVFGTVFVVALVCYGFWRLDFDSTKTKKQLEASTKNEKKNIFYMDPDSRTEFARSWIESRYDGESRSGFALQRLNPKKAASFGGKSLSRIGSFLSKSTSRSSSSSEPKQKK